MADAQRDPHLMMIDRLMERNPDAVRRNYLNPTRCLDAEAMYRGKLVPLCISTWCTDGQTDYHVGTVRYRGPETDEEVTANYTYSGSKGVWTHDVYLGGPLGMDPAWQEEERRRAPLEPHEFTELGMLLATARVIQAPGVTK
jgi:hypothetical protein